MNFIRRLVFWNSDILCCLGLYKMLTFFYFRVLYIYVRMIVHLCQLNSCLEHVHRCYMEHVLQCDFIGSLCNMDYVLSLVCFKQRLNRAASYSKYNQCSYLVYQQIKYRNICARRVFTDILSVRWWCSRKACERSCLTRVEIRGGLC